MSADNNNNTAKKEEISVLSDVAKNGAFQRKPSTYRDWISTEADAKFPPAANRYVLYVSYACPWACRCLTVLFAKKLDKVIDVVIVHPIFTPTKPEVDNHVGWVFGLEFDGKTLTDPIMNTKNIRELYETTCPEDREQPTRFTVPVLFDKQQKLIVNNESSEIIQMFNDRFNAFCGDDAAKNLELYPQELKEEIDRVNEWTYESINNGVYKCGFARSQEAYDEASVELFSRLEEVDQLLDKRRFLAGNRITLADVRLVQTFIRFDTVYVVHFKTAKKCIREFKNIHNYMLDVVQTLDMERGAINMKHIQTHYFCSHASINPFKIIPQMPVIDFKAPHGRDTKKYVE